jgi:hypothetical protein
VHDDHVLPALLAIKRAPLAQVTGYGAYEGRACYVAVAGPSEQLRAVSPSRDDRRAGRPVRPRRSGHRRSQPPRRRRSRQYTLHVWQHGNCAAPPLPRDEHVRRVGLRRWGREVGYHRRSLVETAVWRLVRPFGPGLAAQSLAAETTVARLPMTALNRVTQLDMLESFPVPAWRAGAGPPAGARELRNRATASPTDPGLRCHIEAT